MLNSHKSKYAGESYHNTLSSRLRYMTEWAFFCGLGLLAIAKQDPHGTDPCLFWTVFAFLIQTHGFKSPGRVLRRGELVKWCLTFWESIMLTSPFGHQAPRPLYTTVIDCRTLHMGKGLEKY
jgi:hypothetical protein